MELIVISQIIICDLGIHSCSAGLCMILNLAWVDCQDLGPSGEVGLVYKRLYCRNSTNPMLLSKESYQLELKHLRNEIHGYSFYLLFFSRKRRFFRSPGCMQLDMGGMWKKMHHSLEIGQSIQVLKPPSLFIEAGPIFFLLLFLCLLFPFNCDIIDKIL